MKKRMAVVSLFFIFGVLFVGGCVHHASIPDDLSYIIINAPSEYQDKACEQLLDRGMDSNIDVADSNDIFIYVIQKCSRKYQSKAWDGLLENTKQSKDN